MKAAGKLGVLVSSVLFVISSDYPRLHSMEDGNSIFTNDILIDSSKTNQLVTGFGASSAFIAYEIKSLAEPLRTEVLDLLFTRKGAKISIIRNEIRPDYDFEKPNFPEIQDKAQYWLMQEAVKRGVSQFYSVPWSPPAKMKANKNINGTKLQNFDPNLFYPSLTNYLLPSEYENYARYLSSYLKKYDEKGIKIMTLGIQNEPDQSTKYQSCVWNKFQLTDFVKILGKVLREDQTHVWIQVAEATGWYNSYKYVKHALEDELASPHISVVASHGYGGGSMSDFGKLGTDSGKQVWQTEYSTLGTVGEKSLNIGDGLIWADRIIDALKAGNVNAWFYWWLVKFLKYGDLEAQALLIYDVNTAKLIIPKRFWCFAHFSRFVRPGDIRIDSSGQYDLKSVAFVDQSKSRIVLTVLNTKNLATSFKVTFSNAVVESNVLVYRTSATEDVKELENENVYSNEFEAVVPARSVTTYIFPLAAK
ncbi:MAG: hypothetical protein HY606_12065 [Planctomycetes bacterium]|nr:hypothetical protein [Planctomycetota bacterium]